MVPCDDAAGPTIDPDDPQRLLIVAYTRLFLLPERPDGSKLTTIAGIGCYDIRLIELPIASTPTHVHPLWVELHNTSTGRVLDSAGCRDLLEAGAATQRFIAEARRLSDAGPP